MSALLELAERCEKAIFPCPDDASAAEVVAIRSAICHLMTGRGYDAYSPDYIGSIDSAMTLVPEGYSRSVRKDCDGCISFVWRDIGTGARGEAATEALAICAAALRALASAIEGFAQDAEERLDPKGESAAPIGETPRG